MKTAPAKAKLAAKRSCVICMVSLFSVAPLWRSSCARWVDEICAVQAVYWSASLMPWLDVLCYLRTTVLEYKPSHSCVNTVNGAGLVSAAHWFCCSCVGQHADCHLRPACVLGTSHSCCLSLTTLCLHFPHLRRSSSDGVVSAPYPGLGGELLGCEQSALEQMMQDQYGNYVVQKTLEVRRCCFCAAVFVWLLLQYCSCCGFGCFSKGVARCASRKHRR